MFSCHIMTVKGLKVSSIIHARIKARINVGNYSGLQVKQIRCDCGLKQSQMPSMGSCAA